MTDPELARSGLVAPMRAALSDVVVFDQAGEPPSEADILTARRLYRERRRDSLVALGGRGAIDAAKAVRLLVAQPGPLSQYDVTAGGTRRILTPGPPLIAVPTSAGSGSEASPTALVRLGPAGPAAALVSPHLLPSTAICDPALTFDLPPERTAATGLEAFSQCVESFLSTTYHPLCDGLALEGLRHLARGLEVAVRDGGDRHARAAVMMGALLGGISSHKGLGVVRALALALGSDGPAAHLGTRSAILLPHALRFLLPHAETALTELAQQLGVGRSANAPAHLITLTELVLARLPLPSKLGQVAGLDRTRIPDYARLALLDHSLRTTPRPCTQADLEDLLERAW